MKMATTPVELMTEPSPATASIKKINRRFSSLPALMISPFFVDIANAMVISRFLAWLG